MENILEMNKPIAFLILLFVSYSSMGQKYDKSKHTIPDQQCCSCDFKPTDHRTQFYDKEKFAYRPYLSRDEVLSVLKPNMRTAMCGQDIQHAIVINSGGKLIPERAVIVGGENTLWGFVGGYADSNLVKIKLYE
jgi:hypothetical protein